ncbi:MAG: hypothetical protein RLZZ623_3021 [Actinomycetota bacterium]
MAGMTPTLFFDPSNPDLAHVRLECPEAIGLVDVVEHHLDEPCTNPELAIIAAHQLGLATAAALVPHARRCPVCAPATVTAPVTAPVTEWCVAA